MSHRNDHHTSVLLYHSLIFVAVALYAIFIYCAYFPNISFSSDVRVWEEICKSIWAVQNNWYRNTNTNGETRQRWSKNDRNLTSFIRKFTVETAHEKFRICSERFWQSVLLPPPLSSSSSLLHSKATASCEFYFCSHSVRYDRAVSRVFSFIFPFYFILITACFCVIWDFFQCPLVFFLYVHLCA